MNPQHRHQPRPPRDPNRPGPVVIGVIILVAVGAIALVAYALLR